MNKGKSYFKALKVIDSCITEEHFDATRSYLDNYFNIHITNATSYLEHKAALELFEILLNRLSEKINKIEK